MLPTHPTEQAVGMAHYVSETPGVGGSIKYTPGAFQVREIEGVDPEPADADPGAYAHLVLRVTLEGWDTNEFATRLANGLGISRERVRWAGTKDANARTTQLFTVQGISMDDCPTLPNADITPVGRLGRGLSFGDLAGNEFTITVAHPERPENATAITEELQAFADGGDRVGVPNYFGQQRFGSRRPITHEVGLAIVRGSWRDAVETYVGQSYPDEPERTQRARETFTDTEDPQDALEAFPGHLRHERAMLHSLVEAPGEYRRALEQLPTTLQRLLVHAAQSYLYNRILSERLRRGLPVTEPVPGDIVCFLDRDAPGDLERPDPDRTQAVDEGRLETVTRHCERGRAFVTGPLIGTDTTLAAGEPGAIERDVLEGTGLEPDDFDLPGEFGSSGTRRGLVLMTSIDLEEDPLRAQFALPPGAYATVVLREYLKVDPARMA